jgi:hypothetical protein
MYPAVQVEGPTFFKVQVIVKASPGAKVVLSWIVWETHWARFSIPASCVPVETAAVSAESVAVTVSAGDVGDSRGVALGAWVGVAAGGRVGLGNGVIEGVKARTWVTWASTVEATSVRRGFRSGVGVLVGVAVPQAANPSRLRNTAITPRVFKVCAIWLFLCWCGRRHCPPGDLS